MTDHAIDAELRRHRLLAELSEADRARLAGLAVELAPAVGHYLVVSDTPVEAIYLVDTAAVVIEQTAADGETVNVDLLRHGDLLAGSLQAGACWDCDGLVVEPGRIWRLDASALRAAMAADPRFGCAWLSIMLSATGERLRLLRGRLGKMG